MRNHFKDAACGVASPVSLIDKFFHLHFGIWVDTSQRHLVALAKGHQFLPGGLPFQPGRTHRDNVAQYADVELRKKRFG